MSRKKKHEAHANHERWLISYADFITLLFAFFVVMFASSQADKGKAQQVSESVRRALEQGALAPKLAAILGGTVHDAGRGSAMRRGPGGGERTLSPEEVGQEQESLLEPGAAGAESDPVVAELLPSLEYLSRELEEELRTGRLQISLEARGLVVSLPQTTFFPSGEDTIDPATYPMIEKVARVIHRIPNPVRLEGHTDSVPIHNTRFPSNWELSAARSIAMLNLLAGRFGVPRGRLAIAGYADNAPVESNESERGRARNRRVDIVILNQLGLMREPEAFEEQPGEPQPPERS